MAVIESFPLRNAADLLRYPWILNYLYIMGFCFIGLVFYIKFERYNINPVRFLKLKTKKTFLICLLAIVGCIIVMGVLITLIWHYFYYEIFDQETFLKIDRLSILTSVMGLIMYIAIFIIGLSFFHLFTAVFYNQRYPDILAPKKRMMINIAVIIGIIACILQFINMVLYISWINNYSPYIELGSDFWLYTLNIPYSVSFLLVVIYMMLIFNAIVKTVPFRLTGIVMGKTLRIDASSNFRIASVLIVIFSITKAITGMILYRNPVRELGFFGRPIQEPPLQDVIIESVYRFLQGYSHLFVYFGFLLFCIGFHHIFRTWEIQKLMEPGKPT